MPADHSLVPWQGTALQLKNILCTTPGISIDAGELLGSTHAAGIYLGRLEGERTEKLPIRKGMQHWRLNGVDLLD